MYLLILTSGITVRDGSTANNAFHLNDLHALNIGMGSPYLEPKSAVFRKIFLYLSFDRRSSGNSRGILGAFVLEGTNKDSDKGMGANHVGAFTAKAHLWLVQRSGALLERPPMNKIFRRFCPDQCCTCKFTSLVVSSASDAFNRCNDFLAAYVRMRKGPTIVVAQGSPEARGWRKSVSVLQQFPILLMPSSPKDEDFPALNWQIRICNIMVQRFLLLPQWFNDRLLSARYSHIPIGNLGRDADMTMIDVSFARQLIHNRHILWAAPGAQPDLGGCEVDSHNVWSDSPGQPIISNEGAYRNICVELEVFGLAVQAMMASGLLDAQGLTTPTVNAPKGDMGRENPLSALASSLSTDASCARAFTLLKAEVTKWSQQFLNTENLHAEVLLMGLYRYLCGRGQTLLHDPSLHRIVYTLMIKLFLKLMSEFKKLGSVIVYADFYRIIISTGRYDYESVTEYIDFIVAAVMTDMNLFQFIQINVKCLWCQLLWLDSENWSGMPLNIESPDTGHDGDIIDNVIVDVSGSDANDTSALDWICDTNKFDHIDDQRESTRQAHVPRNLHIKENDQADGDEASTRDMELTLTTEKSFCDDNEEDSQKDEYEFLNFTDDSSVETMSGNEYEMVNNRTTDEDYENRSSKSMSKNNQTAVEGHWDLVAFLPNAAGIYLRHATGELRCICFVSLREN